MLVMQNDTFQAPDKPKWKEMLVKAHARFIIMINKDYEDPDLLECQQTLIETLAKKIDGENSGTCDMEFNQRIDANKAEKDRMHNPI
jgi:t-SNARE complex subunit (syntaxin)